MVAPKNPAINHSLLSSSIGSVTIVQLFFFSFLFK